MVPMPDALLQLRVPPQAHLCGVVRERIVEFASSRGIGGSDLSYFLVAFGEALANAIEHGLGDDPILIECRIGEDRIVARIEDFGLGFTGPPPVVPELPDPLAERGRGLAIMRRCSDIFSLSTMQGRGTNVTIGRYLKHSADSESMTA